MQLARRMAPIPRIGLESRMADRAPQLDLQQCVILGDGEPALLRDFILAAHPAAEEGEGPWARLGRFCTAWADPGTLLHHGIAEVFLEYDLDTAPRPTSMPSVFFAAGERSVAREALGLLLPAPWPHGLDENLARCFTECPTGACVAYIGAMLGRATEGLRVNVKGLRLDDLVPFLRAVGWSGSPSCVEQWAAWAFDRVDRITVCLDVGTDVHPRLGLEAVLAFQPPGEPRWQALLEELSSADLCTSESASGFLNLPGVLRPPETHGEWPAPWIAASLCGPADQFSTTERRLSHLKLTVTDQDVSLKGYWGAGHVWRAAHPEVEEPASDADRFVEQALDDAVAFVLSRQAHTGRWSDFFLPAGPSDEWVTAFVAACLLEAGADAARVGAERAWRALLLRRGDEPGWGYNRLTPADADSTAWALRLAGGLGAQDERVAAARRFLDGHVLAGGGLTTYADRDPIRRYARLPEDASLAGWQADHACVTAAAAPIVGDRAVKYLAGRQTPAGGWKGYWWWDDEYTTALAAEACAATRVQAVAWAQRRVGATGAVLSTDGEPSPWATAWCVRILRLGTNPGCAGGLREGGEMACERATGGRQLDCFRTSTRSDAGAGRRSRTAKDDQRARPTSSLHVGGGRGRARPSGGHQPLTHVDPSSPHLPPRGARASRAAAADGSARTDSDHRPTGGVRTRDQFRLLCGGATGGVPLRLDDALGASRAITANAAPEDRERWLAAGMVGYLIRGRVDHGHGRPRAWATVLNFMTSRLGFPVTAAKSWAP